MGRPRRPYNGVEEINPHRDPWLQSQASTKLGVRQRQRWNASKNWSYRAVNGLYDPLTYLFVLDAVAGIDPDIELRTKNLVAWLNANRTQFYWDGITVGKVLSDLCDQFEDALGAKTGILEQGHDYRGAFYRIHHNGETADLYHKVREDLMRLAEDEMALRARGEKPPRLVSPLNEVPALRGQFSEAV